MLCTPSSNEALRGSESASSMPATLLEKARALEDEAIVLPDTDAWCVHRQPSGEVWVVWTDDHPAVAPRGAGGALVQHEMELCGTLLLPLRSAAVAGRPPSADRSGWPAATRETCTTPTPVRRTWR